MFISRNELESVRASFAGQAEVLDIHTNTFETYAETIGILNTIIARQDDELLELREEINVLKSVVARWSQEDAGA